MRIGGDRVPSQPIQCLQVLLWVAETAAEQGAAWGVPSARRQAGPAKAGKHGTSKLDRGNTFPFTNSFFRGAAPKPDSANPLLPSPDPSPFAQPPGGTETPNTDNLLPGFSPSRPWKCVLCPLVQLCFEITAQDQHRSFLFRFARSVACCNPISRTLL